MTTLLELAARCEAAEGADRELDGQIGRYKAADFLGYVPTEPQTGCGAFTASLDAAMTLVPEGWLVTALEQHWRTRLWRAQIAPAPSEKLLAAFDAGRTVGWETADSADDGSASIATPALALCAAALRARDANPSHPDDRGERG